MYNLIMTLPRDPDIDLDKLKWMLPDSFGNAYMTKDGHVLGYRDASEDWIEYWNWKAKKSWSAHVRRLMNKAQKYEDSLVRELDDESIMSIGQRS